MKTRTAIIGKFFCGFITYAHVIASPSTSLGVNSAKQSYFLRLLRRSAPRNDISISKFHPGAYRNFSEIFYFAEDFACAERDCRSRILRDMDRKPCFFAYKLVNAS